MERKELLQTLHRSLLNNNYDVPEDYDSFKRTLSAPGREGYINRHTLWKSLRDNGYDVPDNYESFSNTLFVPVSKHSQVSTASPSRATSTSLPQGFGDLDTSRAIRHELARMRGRNTWEQPSVKEITRPSLKPNKQTIPSQHYETPEQPSDDNQDSILKRVTKGQLTPEENQRVQKRMQQRADEIAYEDETGNRMKQPVLNTNFEAPALARDEYGNVRRDANGNPLIGFTTDEDAVAEHRDIAAEQAEWDRLPEKEKRERAYQAKLEAERANYTEPTLWDTIKKDLGSGIIRKGAELVDFMQQMTSGMIVEDPSKPSGFMKTADYDEQQKDKRNPLTRLSGYLHDTAETMGREAQPYQGKSYLDMLWDGEIGGVLQKGVGTALESLPMTLSAYNPVTMIMNGILMASGNYRDQLMENPDIPAAKRFSMAVGMAAIEQLTEKYSDPVFKYVGGSKLLKGAAKGATEEIASDVTRKATESLAKRIMKGLGGIAKDAAGEGAEEIISDFGNDALGELLDVLNGEKDYGIRAQWEKYKKENPNADLKDFAFQKAKEYIEDGIAGGMAGAYMSGTTQATVKGLQYAFGNKVSEEDIANNPNSRIDPMTMEVAKSFDDGYTSETPDEMKSFADEAKAAEQILPEYGKEFAKMVTESDSPVETMDYLLRNREYYTDEQIAAAYDYYNKRAASEGMMQGALDKIDQTIESANAEVAATTHQATGNVITAQVGDGAYYIIGGDIATDEQTGQPMVVGTGGAVVVMDPITGEKSVVPASQVAVTSMTPADEMIQYNETVLRQQLTQQADDDITYGSPANEVFDLEDTVTLTDDQGNTIEGEVVGLPNSVDGVFQVQTNDTKDPIKYLTADDMNRRIVAHNGQEIQRGTPTVPVEEVKTNTVLGAPEVEQSASEGQGNDNMRRTEEGGAARVDAAASPERQEQSQSALSRIPVRTDNEGNPLKDKKGRPILDWHKASVDDTASALVEMSKGNMLTARDTANDLINNAKARLEKIRKEKPKTNLEDPADIIESRMEIQQREQETQQIIKHWQDVSTAIRKQMEAEAAERRAAEEAAKSAEQKAREAEEARIRKEKQDAIDAERRRKKVEEELANWNKPYAPLAKARKEMEGDRDALDILDRAEPETLEEWVSSLIQPQSMMWDDETDPTTGRTITGLQSELGLQKKDIERIGGLVATRQKGGKPFGQVVHDIWEQLPEGVKNMYDDQDVRNALIGLFGEGNATRMRHLTEEHRIEEARAMMKENARRDSEAEMEAWAEAYHLTPEERETFEEFLALAPMEGAEAEFINQIIEENEKSDRRSEAVDMQPAGGTAGRESEGGESQVPGQSAPETAGDDQNQRQSEPGAETGNGEPPVPDTDVPGGTPGTIAPSEQLKPTDLRDAVRPESAELGVNEANAKARALTEEEAAKLMQRMEDAAVDDPQISLTPESWASSFGLNNSLETPVGNVKMGEGQYQKFFDKARSAEFGMAVQTLKDPDVVLIEPSQAKEGQTTERPYSYIFVKTFVRDGQKMKYFASVTVQRDNMEVSVSSHIMKPSRVLERLTTLERLYTKETLLPNSSEWHLAEQQNAVPDLLPTQGNNVTSDGKVTNNFPNNQEKSEKSSQLGKTSSPEQIAEQEAKVDTNPTEGQKEAGNYQKGHIKVDGLDITIENPKGSVRSGVDADGNPWEVTMNNTYGYIRGTESVDGDHIDVFLSDDPTSGNVFVVDQVKPDGSFDEVKVMYGFKDAAEAAQAYLSNYSKGWKGLGAISGVSREAFKEWIDSSRRKTKPFREYALAKREQARLDKENENKLNNDDIISDIDENDVPLQKRSSKSYTDREGVYHEGLEEELQNIEQTLRQMVEGTAEEGNGESKQRTPAELRRRASIIRAELAGRQRAREELRQKYNINEKGDISLDDLTRMFRDLNSDEAIGRLFERVLNVLKNLKLNYRFTDKLPGGVNGRAQTLLNMTFYDWDAQTRDMDDQQKARVLLHEMIHNVTSQILLYARNMPLLLALSPKQLSAARKLNSIYKEVKKASPKRANGKDFYALDSVDEMVAELANPEFREALSQIEIDGRSLWQRIKDAIREMLGLETTSNMSNALKESGDILEDILDTFGPVRSFIHSVPRQAMEAGEKIFGDNENLTDRVEADLQNSKGNDIQEELSLMGVHNISEDKLKKVIKAGGLANPSLAVIDTKQGFHNGYGEISLIPKSDMIDARTGGNAGTYMGDAYTPTYPTVETSLSDKGRAHIDEIARQAAGDNEQLMRHLRGNLKDYVEGNGSRLHYLFLQQTGRNPQPVNRRLNYSENAYNELKDMVDGDILDKRELTQEESDRILNAMLNERYAKYGDKLTPERKEMIEKNVRSNDVGEDGKLFFSRWYTFMEALASDARNRKNPQVDWYGTDIEAQNRVIDEKLSDEYEEWKKNLLNDDDVNEELFDGYTKDGYRRTVPNTVYNASRIMNKQGDVNAYDSNGIGATRATLLEKVNTLAQIRKNKGRIKVGDDVEQAVKDASDNLFEILQDISNMQKISDNHFMNIDYAEARLQEAFGKKDPLKHLRDEYGYDIDEDSELGQRIKDFVQTVKKMPVKYFETKFKRPVWLDEFAVAVVPETTSPDVVEALKNAGLDVRTYDASDEKTRNENRRKVAMDAVSSRGDILFQKADAAPEAPAQKERTLRDALVDLLKSIGIDVITDNAEGQRTLDEANGLNKAQKRAVETASLIQKEGSLADISTADGAKIVKKLESLANKLEKVSNLRKNFLNEAGKALEATQDGSNSWYKTFKTPNGEVTIRLGNHNATVSSFDFKGENNGISIVISKRPSKGIDNNGTAHIVEYFYPEGSIRKAYGKPLADIVRSIKDSLGTGEYVDPTGLAEREEVNDTTKFFRTKDGQAYGYTYNGKIYLDPSIATAETPVHEYTHLWAEAVRQKDSKTWANIVDVLKNDPAVRPFWDKVAAQYPELTDENDIAEEVLAQYSGRRGSDRLREVAGDIARENGGIFGKAQAVEALRRMRNILARFWKAVADVLGWQYSRADEIADKVLYDLLSGVDPKEQIKEKYDEELKDYVLSEFNRAKNGNAPGERIPFGKLTEEGRKYLEGISGMTMKPDVSFILNASELRHIYNDHYGDNEKDKGNNIPLTDGDIRTLVDVVTSPDKVVFAVENKTGRKLFFFLKNAGNGTYNMAEVYADSRGNLTTKSFYKTKKSIAQRANELLKDPKLSTSETDGESSFSGANIPKLFENSKDLSEKAQNNGIKQQKADTSEAENNGPMRQGENIFDYARRVMERREKKIGESTPEPTAESVARDIYEYAIRDTGDAMMIPALFRALGNKEARERFKHKFAESWFDYTRSIGALQEAIEKATGKAIQSFEDVRMTLNAKSSIDSIEREKIMNDLIQPLSEYVGNMVLGKKIEGHRMTIDDVEKYLNAVHGIERNEQMAMKQAQDEYAEDVAQKRQQLENGKLSDKERKSVEASLLIKEARFKGIRQYMDNETVANWYRQRQRGLDTALRNGRMTEAEYRKERQKLEDEYEKGQQYKYRGKDYSGLTALFGETEDGSKPTEEQLEQSARDYAAEFEKIVGKELTDGLWERVKALNNWSLRKAYESGLISKQQYLDTNRMYQHYVPLRGWHDDYAGDIYQFIARGEPAEVLQGVLKKAYGRKSRAARIFGTMAAMANTAIVQGNKNIVAQNLLNMALNHADSGLLMVNEQYYQKDADGNIVPLFPKLDEKMTADEMRQELERFDETMKRKEDNGEVQRYSKKFAREFPLHMAKWQERQHAVRVMRNGKEYMVYILGSPRAAQAFNGLLNPNSRPGIISDTISKYMRFLAKMQTSLSPEFLISNFQRDVTTAATSAYVKYGKEYQKDFIKNVTSIMPLTKAILEKAKGEEAKNWGGIFSLFRKYDNGTLDMNDETERYFKEFIESGGMTGISFITKSEEYQDSMEKIVKRMREGKLGKVKNARKAVADAVEFANKGIENATRFATYMTSRQHGKNVRDSIFDAKEGSVNFNMKGSGAWGNMFARRNFLYVNPAMQSLRMIGTWYENDPDVAVRKGAKMVTKAVGKRFMKAAAMTLAASTTLAMMNIMLSALWHGDGDDDDEDKGIADKSDWWSLSEWDRYNYINIINPFGNGYFRWSIPQEWRPVWALGQIGVDLAFGRITPQRGLQSMLLQLNNVSPLSFFEGGTDTGESIVESELRTMTPSYVSPFTDALLWNRDFMGHPITNRGDWNKNKPEWQRAGKNTPEIMINASRKINEMTGGRTNKRGWLENDLIDGLNNPSALYYILTQQFGGIGSMAKRSMNLYDQWRDPEQEVEVRNVPFLPKFYVSTGDDYSRERVTNDKFWMYWNEYKDADNELSADRSDVKNDKMKQEEADRHIEERKADGTYDRWKLIEDNNLDNIFKEARGTDLEGRVKKMVVDMMESGKAPDWQAMLESREEKPNYGLWVKALDKQRTAHAADITTGQAMKEFDEADEYMRPYLAKKISKDAGASEDPYGGKPQSDHAYQYQLQRTAQDVWEDAILLDYQENAKEKEDETLKKQISKERSEVHNPPVRLHGGRSDSIVMDNIRKGRKRLLEKYGLDKKTLPKEE